MFNHEKTKGQELVASITSKVEKLVDTAREQKANNNGVLPESYSQVIRQVKSQLSELKDLQK